VRLQDLLRDDVTSLTEALEFGEGIERPFRCTEHDDSHASASVNVVKGFWYCYVCHAKGAIDKKRVPSLAEIAMMLEPERNCRIYPDAYLSLFEVEPDEIYWRTRFPDWLCWFADLGEDPTTREATYPVRTPSGHLAGVGRRQTDAMVAAAKEAGENPSRYKYPVRWSASRVLHYTSWLPGDVLVLVEGVADAVSLWECGIPAAAVYGSALHLPQKEYINRLGPKYVCLGMDADDAGQRGVQMSWDLLDNGGRSYNIGAIEWPKNDPAECTPAERLEAVCNVAGDQYLDVWQKAGMSLVSAYIRHKEEMG
jgi:hypothetical protein